jgi:hypothetical protein
MNKLILIIILILFVSCKTKKKIVERGKEVTATTINETVNEIKKTDVVIGSVTKLETSKVIITKDKTLILTQADSTKVIVIEDETGAKLTIKGANVVLTDVSKVEDTTEDTTINLSKIDKSEIIKSTKKDTQSNSKKTSRNTNTDIKGTSTWLWVALIFIAIFFIVKYKSKLFTW